MTAEGIEYIPPKKKKKRELIPIKEGATRIDRTRAEAATPGMEILDPRKETFEERQQRLVGKRVPYAGMVAHQEMAAMVLAAGGTIRLAAHKAGISKRQVKKYYQSADFRNRINELRQVVFSKITGRVLKELEARTDPDVIGNIDLLDLLRVWDRLSGTPKGGGGLNIGEVNVTNNNYDALVAALLSSKSRGEGRDFPGYEPEELQLPDKSSSE